jgi:hypothetical protein
MPDRSIVMLTASSSIAALFLCMMLSNDSRSQEQDAVTSVNASDLLHNIQIRGMLGTPFGKIVKVRGEWRGPGARKSSAMRFAVTEIDGQPARGLEFTELNVRHALEGGRPHDKKEKWDWVAKANGIIKTDPPKAVAGAIWEMQAFETGQITGYPDDLREAYGADNFAQGSWARYEITPELRYTKLRLIRLKN